MQLRDEKRSVRDPDTLQTKPTHSEWTLDTDTASQLQMHGGAEFVQSSLHALPHNSLQQSTLQQSNMKRSMPSISSSQSRDVDKQIKRLKGDASVPDCPLSQEDAVASLLALFSKPSEETKVKACNEEQRLVSDDEGDDDRSVASSSQDSLASTRCNLDSDWRSFSRPLGPPPRLPMVPAGYAFPPRF